MNAITAYVITHVLPFPKSHGLYPLRLSPLYWKLLRIGPGLEGLRYFIYYLGICIKTKLLSRFKSISER